MNKIDPLEVAKKYNSIDKIWDEKDKWHSWVKHSISLFLKKSLKYLPNSKGLEILNAGSGGYSYNFSESNILHVDIAKNKIEHLPNSIVADIHNLPLENEKFDLIILCGKRRKLL